MLGVQVSFGSDTFCYIISWTEWCVMICNNVQWYICNDIYGCPIICLIISPMKYLGFLKSFSTFVNDIVMNIFIQKSQSRGSIPNRFLEVKLLSQKDTFLKKVSW